MRILLSSMAVLYHVNDQLQRAFIVQLIATRVLQVASTIQPCAQMGPLCRILHVQPALSGLQTSRSLIVKSFFIQFDLK